MKEFRMFFGMVVVLLLCGSIPLAAQNTRTISGKVTSALSSEPISGAIVVITGSEVYFPEYSDGEGLFSIETSEASVDVEVWAPGYYSITMTARSIASLSFVLIPEDRINYNEVIVLPFRSIEAKKKASNATNLSKQNFSNGGIYVDQLLQNVIPGLRVVNKSGMPGEGSYINSRGVSSFIGGSSPLIVIDGVPYLPDMSESLVIEGYSSSVFNALSASDIKNITFLRGSDAAIYGSLGSNGVVMIETDDATDLETRVEFVAQYGIATQSKMMPVMGVDDYKTYIGNIALSRYSNMADVLELFPYLRDNPDYHFKFLYNNNTDWQKEIFNPAFVTENILKIKGGDAIAKYDLSFGYLNQRGYIDNTGFTRYHMRLNSNINVSKRVELFATMSMAYLTNDLMEQGMSLSTNPLLAAMAKAPLLNPFQKDENNNRLPDYATIRNQNGGIHVNNAVSNPVALVNTAHVLGQGYNVLMNGGINYLVNDNWKVTGMIGLFHNYNREEVFIPGLTNNAIMPLSEGLAGNTVRMGIGEAFNLYYNLHTSWNKQLASRNSVTVTAGYQAITTRREFDAGEGRNTSSDFYKTLDNVSTIGRGFFGYINEWNWMNFFATANYNYRDFLSAGVNVALDGSSASGPDANRMGLFPAVNAVWNIKNMSFMNEVDFVNRLNLRAEYAITGNSSFSSNISEYYYENQVFRQLSGIVRAGIPNTSLKWENNATANIGLDISLLRHRLDLMLDVYDKISKDVIVDRRISSAFGTNSLYDNLAKIQNRGIEAGLQAFIVQNSNFHWLLGGSIATNKNEVKSLGGENQKIMEFGDGSAVVTRVGETAYSFYGYKTDGVYATTQEAQATGFVDYAGNVFQVGDVRFVNVDNSNSVLDDNDRVILGNADPDFFGRFYTSVGYNNVRLTANFTYSYGNEAYNAVRREFESVKGFGNQLVSVTRAWQAEGQVTDIPRAVYGDPMNNNRFSDRWIEDASFIKLKELTLSYNFGNNLVKFIRGGTLYVSGENLLTFTDYLGFDPEFAYSHNASIQGFDYGKIPLARTYKLGFRLLF